MGLSVNQLIDELRAITGVDSDDLPTPDVELLLNRSWWDLMNKVEFRETEMSATFNTVAGSERYEIAPPFEALKSLSVLNPATNTWQLVDVFDTRVYDSNLKPDVLEQGIPTRYFRENKTVVFYPTPDAVYEIKIRYMTTLADLAAGGLEPIIPQVWHEIILLGAVWRCYQRLGDMARKDSIKGDWIGLLNNIKTTKEQETVDTKFAGVVPLRRGYGMYAGKLSTRR
jgi:hypothetical protein